MSTEAMDTSGPPSPERAKSMKDILASEFNVWDTSVEADKNIIKLNESLVDEDGKVSLLFLLDARQKFTLHCPLDYPAYLDDNFFIEADPGLQLWSNALNEFILDSQHRLLLPNILTKGASLYSSADQAAAAEAGGGGGGAANVVMGGAIRGARYSDDEDDELMEEDERESEFDSEDDGAQGDDEQLDDILETDLSWELEISRRKKRWKAKEEEIRADSAAAAAAQSHDPTTSAAAGSAAAGAAQEEDRTLHQLYHDPAMRSRQPKTVFTKAGASGVLINDLVSIMETKQETGIEADTIDDNIFQWSIKLRNFSSNCILDKDFSELQSIYGYDYIELQLDFSMDLYPFFPPLVKVIRPRLQGSMMLRVTTMEILKLSYWNPARDMKSVISEVKSFLQQWARLDLQSERNDKVRYPDGAYIDIEHHLLRLALVSEMVPRANKKYVTSPPPKAALPPTAMEPTPPAAAAANSGDKKKAEEEKKQKSKFAFLGLASIKEKDKDSEESVRKKSLPSKSMPKGTGYSSHLQKGWDVKAYKAAQKEKDKQIELVLEKIYQELKKLHGSHQMSQRNAQPLPDLVNPIDGAGSLVVGCVLSPPDLPSVEVDARLGGGGAHRNSRRKRKHSPDEIAAAAAAAAAAANGPVDPLSDLYAVLEGSALVPFLESKLQANSFLEICSHTSVYKCIVNIIREIVTQPSLVSLLGPMTEQQQSLQKLLLSLETQAKVLLEKIGKASANGSVPKSGKSTDKVADKPSDDKLARDFLSLSKEVSKALKQTGFLPDINGESSSLVSSDAVADRLAPPPPAATIDVAAAAAASTAPPRSAPNAAAAAAPAAAAASAAAEKHPCRTETSSSRESPASWSATAAIEESYKKHMKSLQFDSHEFSMTGTQGHAYATQLTKGGVPNSAIIFRVAQELSSLATDSLPLDFSSSIFVRSDDDKATLLRAIITGPEDTPYTGGCYLFDVYFPPKYPTSAPQVSFRTTGSGTVRFNPNLYACGKVCLSLLGTWGGSPGEQWNETSTILQVLISIQSLILCSEPYFNEPGYERIYGTPQGEVESNKYNEDVFKNNLKLAILGQLQNPPEGFEQVVRSHFYLKREALLQELEKLLEKYKSKDSKKLVGDVRKELLKLEEPPHFKSGASL